MLLSEPGTDPTSHHRRHPPLVSLSGVLLPAERMGAKGGVGGGEGARGGMVSFSKLSLGSPLSEVVPLFILFRDRLYFYLIPATRLVLLPLN